MASAHSQVETYLPYTPTTDINLVNTVLATKEAKYDANVAQIDALLEQFGSVDLVRQSDKEYLGERLNTLVNNVNKYGKLDLSNNNVSRNIKNYIKDALDDRVLNAIEDTQKLRSYQQQWQEIKKKNPEQYSDMNYQVGLMDAGYQEYLQDETGQVRLGDLSVNPYMNVNQELDKAIKENLELFGIERTTLETGQDGLMYKVTKNIVEPDRVKKVIDGAMTPQMRKQLDIESSYYYRNASDQDKEVIQDSYKSDLKSRLSSVNSEILSKQRQLDNSGGTEQKTTLTQEIEQLKQSRDNINEVLSSNKLSYKAAYNNYYNNQLYNQKYKQYVTNELVDYDVDNNFLKLQTQKQKAKQQATTTPTTSLTDNVVQLDTPIGEQAPYTEQIENEYTETTANYRNAVETAIKQGRVPSINYAQYSELNEEDKLKQLNDIQKVVLEGQDLKVSYPKDVVDAAYSLKMARENMNAVINPTKNSIDTLVEQMYDGLKYSYENAGVRGFNPNNFYSEEISNAIKQGSDFSEIKKNKGLYTKLRINFIDQILREDIDLGGEQEEQLRTTRDSLLSELPEGEQKQYVPTNIVGQSEFSNFFEGLSDLAEAGTEAASLVYRSITDRPITQKDKENHTEKVRQAFSRIRESSKERSALGTDVASLNIFQPDQNLRDIDTNLAESDFFAKDERGNYTPIDLNEFIQTGLSSAFDTSRREAEDRVKKSESTKAIVLNANLVGKESQQEVNTARGLLSKLSQATGVPEDSMEDNAVQFSYNKNTGKATISTLLKKGADSKQLQLISEDRLALVGLSEDKSRLTRQFNYDEIPPELRETLVTTIESRAFDAVNNPTAQPHTFSSGLFENDAEKLKTIESLKNSGDIDEEIYTFLNQNLDTRLIDATDVAYMVRQYTKEDGSNVTQEYPNAINNLTNGKYKFKIDYIPVLGQGYRSEVKLVDVTGNPSNTVVLQSNPLVGEYVDPNYARLDALTKQSEIINAIMQGYQQENPSALRTLEKLNALPTNAR